MEKNKNNYVKRKNTISFKQHRNQLHNQRIQGTARKEKQECKTYESNIGMSLEMLVSGATASESITGLVQLIKEDIQKETLSIYEETISPFTPRPNCPNTEFDSNMEYKIILFDVETNTTGKLNLPNCVNFQLSIRPGKIAFPNTSCLIMTSTNMPHE